MHVFKILFIALCLISIFQCISKQPNSSPNQAAEWAEMDSFHMIMAEAFHPYNDSSNLEPVKSHAEELRVEATKWANSPLPEKVNNDAMKTQVQRLKTDADKLAEDVKTGNDEAIAASLHQLHEHFHEVQEAWYTQKGNQQHH